MTVTHDRFLTGEPEFDRAVVLVLDRCRALSERDASDQRSIRVRLDLLDQGFVHRVAAREIVAAYRRAHRVVAPPPGMPRFLAPDERDFDPTVIDDLRLDIRIVDRRADRRGGGDTSSEWSGGSRARADDDSAVPSLLYLQLNRGDSCLRGTPSEALGDNVHVALSMLSEACPNVPAVLAMKRSHAAAFVDRLKGIESLRSAPLTLVLQDEAPSQWARDHAIAMIKPDGSPGVLLPSRATRWDLPGECSPVDESAAEGLASFVPVRRSELLFQGGNVVVCADPARPTSGALVALIGEAELARNSDRFGGPDAVQRAFERELGVERSIVLPNASFHIDFELFVLAGSSRSTVLVADDRTASTLMVQEGLSRFAAAGVMNRRTESTARAALAKSAYDGLAAAIWPWLSMNLTASGSIGPVFALAMSKMAAGRAPNESSPALWLGWADAHRFLGAVDRLISRAEPAWLARMDSPHRAYFEALNRLERARETLAARLREGGWSVTALPSSPDSDVGVNVLNSINVGTRRMTASVVGIGIQVTRTAGVAMDRLVKVGRPTEATTAKGSVSQVASAPVWIDSTESQCRQGSVRCSVLAV